MIEKYQEALQAAGFLLFRTTKSWRSVPFVGHCTWEMLEFKHGVKVCCIWVPTALPKYKIKMSEEQAWKRAWSKAKKTNDSALKYAGVSPDILVIGDVLAVCS
jgi:hypothetical protein